MEATDSLSVVNKIMSPDAIKLDRFDGTNFTRWKDKLFFFLTELGVAYLLSGNLPEIVDPLDAETDEIRTSRKKREEDEVRCRGYILNALSDRLYDLFRSFKSPREIWCALESKYTSEKQGLKISMITECNKATMDKCGDWWYDSGASVHVCNDKNMFKNYEVSTKDEKVLMGNYNTAKVFGKGMIELPFTSGKKLILTNALHILDVRKNLVSGSLLSKRA